MTTTQHEPSMAQIATKLGVTEEELETWFDSDPRNAWPLLNVPQEVKERWNVDADHGAFVSILVARGVLTDEEGYRLLGC